MLQQNRSSKEDDCNRFYGAAMDVLEDAGIPYLVGGAYAFGVYTGISRDTKDFDLFLQAGQLDSALAAFIAAGYETERTFPHWLAKVNCREECIDLIYRAGNGLCEVNDVWFLRAPTAKMLGRPVKLCPPEEMLWMKAFIMERERYDGADIAHLFLNLAGKLDWPHLVRQFGPDWRILLSHLILFGYVYPSERETIPAAIITDLLTRLREEPVSSEQICRGTLLSRQQYLPDIEQGRFRDARLEARSRMSTDDITLWTAAIAEDGSAKS